MHQHYYMNFFPRLLKKSRQMLWNINWSAAKRSDCYTHTLFRVPTLFRAHPVWQQVAECRRHEAFIVWKRGCRGRRRRPSNRSFHTAPPLKVHCMNCMKGQRSKVKVKVKVKRKNLRNNLFDGKTLTFFFSNFPIFAIFDKNFFDFDLKWPRHTRCQMKAQGMNFSKCGCIHVHTQPFSFYRVHTNM